MNNICIIFTFIYSIYIIVFTNAQDDDILANLLGNEIKLITVGDEDAYLTSEKNLHTDDKVVIKLYYESFCPDCRIFDTTQFAPLVLKLSKYLDIHTYPYGNAKTTEHNGHFEFRCQHGPDECYGNKLHACALDNLRNDNTTAILFNCCLMETSHKGHGSDDAAADECASSMNINAVPIKECAKSEKGTELLKYYGDESKKANYSYVPYILVNEVVTDGDNFMKKVCDVFKVPPPPCVQ